MADTAKTPPESTIASPEQRPSSPSLSASPSLALDAIPSLDRSVSTPSNSSASTLSTRSRHSRLSDGGATVVRRRGYMRPQGTAFADSARNRDSVMSLGSIAHMQYYFARTGLLDGKGAQLAKEGKKNGNNKENVEPSISSVDDLGMTSLSQYDGTTSGYAVSDPGQDTAVVESPTDMQSISDAWIPTTEPPMLPPTVSTYKQKPSYTEPLPDMPVLRRELKEALQDACKVIEECQKQIEVGQQGVVESSTTDSFHELQGLHVLDIITLAIRAAKNYYTAHSQPERLYAITCEKRIRGDLYQVLDILKKMASRNFRGGVKLTELVGIIGWIESIDVLLKKEEQAEQAEAEERATWVWREGDWAGREREREWLFLKSFDRDEPPLPPWSGQAVEEEEQRLPNEFLECLADGIRLVRLHNTLVTKSKRQFDLIKNWHTDTSKPYRKAENLRFWMKAAELRWDIHLDFPVSDIVNGKEESESWRKFEDAVFRWCGKVRSELVDEWRLEAMGEDNKRKPPELKIEVPEPDGGNGGNVMQAGAASGAEHAV
ncbi:hypothetical protein D0864_10425 [Hortaea werneckii]|uniref:Calponin-homology (CH) domain-containing protein n=1 Tax=Hortaea werneckii TaxID=91943 RepID=A0A3M7E8Q3_HORWE|nr:hypothetical protein KC352_g15262 [Hortaea werneckii]KAI7563053.1 hypothetical protein KC317_g7998 [Hortaea werneckii]KAI7618258.1 hypothetical protein KC346_g5099 [Hortaea werneckii]KAI7660389.1 hypothetical protein KC319_g8684 [Hortaea werneckii]RMY72434.1 hypothetical protein D0864_10425 [Hortaea werneckii]